MGVELEYLGRLSEAISSFEKAKEISFSMNNQDFLKVLDKSISELKTK